ncbi:BRO family protein, partial [Butyricicoccus sp. 1XD8-22]
MNDLQVFQNSEFGELTVLEIKGKPYFPATACARMLGYKRPADAISAHCKGSAKHRVLT